MFFDYNASLFILMSTSFLSNFVFFFFEWFVNSFSRLKYEKWVKFFSIFSLNRFSFSISHFHLIFFFSFFRLFVWELFQRVFFSHNLNQLIFFFYRYKKSHRDRIDFDFSHKYFFIFENFKIHHFQLFVFFVHILNSIFIDFIKFDDWYIF